MSDRLVHFRGTPTSTGTACGVIIARHDGTFRVIISDFGDLVTCPTCKRHVEEEANRPTINAVTADVARSLADRWDTKADEYVRNMPNGEMVNGIATALHQCAKELRGLCDLAVIVTLPNGQGS